MLEVQSLHKQFGKFIAVDNVSFSLKAGDRLGFLGPNGAGKSTTMKMLCGYLTPTSGTAFLHSKEISELETRKFIGYLPETVPLYKDMKVREFLKFITQIRQVSKNRIQEILELAFLESVADQLIGTLSKGYRQRVGFAQAIIHDPPVLILDEPTDGLDPNQKQEVRNIILNLSKNKAILLSTHILEEMEAICNRVIILNKGKIVMDSTPKKLLEQSPHYHHIFLTLKEKQGKEFKTGLEKVVGVEEVIQKSDKEWIVVPKTSSNLFPKIIRHLNNQKAELQAISTQQGKADEVFRKLTV